MDDNKNKKIYVAGHRGLVGSGIVRNLSERGYRQVVGRTRAELDLLDERATKEFLAAERPDTVILSAAMVGGIHANNTYRTEFLTSNLKIQNNLILASHELGIPNLIFLGSSCIYPRQAPQPMREDCLLGGALEYTNRPYALAKIAGLELVNCIRRQYKRNYFSVMPTNLYGPGDNFHPENSHVLPALLRRFIEAKDANATEVRIWGTGSPLREFMYVDDCADAIVHLMERVQINSFSKIPFLQRDDWSHVNIGSGEEVSIAKLAATILEVIGFRGRLEFDTSKPDGTMRKLLDTSLLRETFDWRPKVSLKEGLERTYHWYLENLQSARR